MHTRKLSSVSGNAADGRGADRLNLVLPMPENTKNLVLEHLRHVRGTLDRINLRLADLVTRPGHV
jgi:hypothetical protein